MTVGIVSYTVISVRQACPWEWDSWETSRGAGQHTFVFPMRLRNRMRVWECYWIVKLRLYFWNFKVNKFCRFACLFVHV